MYFARTVGATGLSSCHSFTLAAANIIVPCVHTVPCLVLVLTLSFSPSMLYFGIFLVAVSESEMP